MLVGGALIENFPILLKTSMPNLEKFNVNTKYTNSPGDNSHVITADSDNKLLPHIK